MGIRLFSSCSDHSHNEHTEVPIRVRLEKKDYVVGNPNPKNFQILECRSVGRFVVILVKYPECLNYKGSKILVFENVPLSTIMNLETLDPHFCDSTDHPSPVARFVPTKKGFDYAVRFCKANLAM